MDSLTFGTDAKYCVVNCNQRCAVSLRQGQALLADVLQSLIRTHAPGSNRHEFIRLQVRVKLEDADDSVLWLRGQKVLPKVFYADPEQRLISAGLGSAHTIQGSGCLESFPISVDSPPEFRYYGGERFDHEASVGSEWSDFGGHLFILPRIELVRSKEQGFDDFCLALNIRVKDCSDGDSKNTSAPEGCQVQKQLEEALKYLKSMGAACPRNSCAVPVASGTELETSWEQWRAAVDGALEQMAAGHMRKVVLARSCLVRLAAAVDPLDLLLRLRPAGSYRFLLQPAAGRAFLGCSPERLFRVSGGVVETVAMAGTCPRGARARSERRRGRCARACARLCACVRVFAARARTNGEERGWVSTVCVDSARPRDVAGEEGERRSRDGMPDCP